MADNANVTAGDGTIVVATDKIGGVDYQRVKLVLGADGTAVDAVAGAGVVGTGVQRTTLASDDPAVTALGAVADAAVTNPASSASAIAALKGLLTLLTTQAGYLDGIEGLLAAATPAGSAIIGRVGIDQTTPGTTNLIAAGQSGAWLAGAKGIDGATIATAANPLPVGVDGVIDGASVTPASQTSAATLFSIDTSGFGVCAVQVTSAGTTCTITYEGSADNTNWVAVAGVAVGNVNTAAAVLTTTTANGWSFNTELKYFRARVSTYTSGTVTVSYTLRRDAQANPPSMTLTGTSGVKLVSQTSGALSAGRLHGGSAATGFFKASVGTLYGFVLTNTTASVRYVHFYAKASAPTLSTDTPILTIMLPASGQPVAFSSDFGWASALGIAYAVTTDNVAIPVTAASAGDVVGSIIYA